ncbi:hypothetical protein AVEN_233027-1 [Araneus ventricosus]|uniref:Uncharacterized protein n=1 Tax=Araneus ventricosus TaxID=182803 RepID=A0A4Y2P5P1_ARAVE|nr:hypothetical protein AVEN_233027-1 [Araneus ventricosus]
MGKASDICFPSVEREILLALCTKTVTRYPLFRNNGDKEKEAFDSFQDVMHRPLGYTKDSLFKTILQHMMTAFEAQGWKMSLTVPFLHSHIDCFPETLGACNEEQGERFHQDVRDIKR